MVKEEKSNNNLRFWINLSIVLLAMVCFFIILFFVLKYDSLKMDNIFYIIFHDKFESKFMTGFYKIYTYLGSFYGLMIIALLVLIVFKDKRLGIGLSLNLIIVGALNFLLKIIVSRPRPEGINIITESGFSFPSGHAMMSIALFGLLIYFAYKFIKNKGLRIFLIIIFSILTLMIGTSRIYLGVHYFSDVLAGFLIGYAVLSGNIYIFNRLYNYKFKKIISNKSNDK